MERKMTPSVQYDFRRWLPETAESPLHYWTSLSPLASAFGVRWRFDDSLADIAETGKGVFDDMMESTAAFGQGAMSALGETADDDEDSDESDDDEDEVEDEDEDDDEVEDAEVVGDVSETADDDDFTKVALGSDDLSLIKGIGPKMVVRLAANGVLRFQDIAAWNTEDVARYDSVLEGIPGRIERDDWVGQARALA
jgi:predicted flap endonuclease-1-like 5' DNA nuclease